MNAMNVQVKMWTCAFMWLLFNRVLLLLQLEVDVAHMTVGLLWQCKPLKLLPCPLPSTKQEAFKL